jgi:hypothetical protein
VDASWLGDAPTNSLANSGHSALKDAALAVTDGSLGHDGGSGGHWLKIGYRVGNGCFGDRFFASVPSEMYVPRCRRQALVAMRGQKSQVFWQPAEIIWLPR